MKNKRQQKPPIWIVLMIFLSVFGGIITGIIGINNIVNYYHPYLFGIIFGGLGLITGMFAAKKLKPIIAVNQRMRDDYYLPTMFILVAFFGVFLLLASMANKKLSEINYHEELLVVDKYRQESGYMRPSVNSIVVKVDKKTQRLVCSYDYWLRTSIGQTVDICAYKSKMGFDFIELSDDE